MCKNRISIKWCEDIKNMDKVKVLRTFPVLKKSTSSLSTTKSVYFLPVTVHVFMYFQNFSIFPNIQKIKGLQKIIFAFLFLSKERRKFL
ncbi:hypothetical protein DRQ17_05180 [bacterium]|nr:MAG: hypothetical protein DRQ17_05180 [bacterium]